MRIGVPRITRIFVLTLTVAMAAPGGPLAHEGEGGEPAHMGTNGPCPDGVECWHGHGPTPEERAAQQARVCEAERAKVTREADAWNHRETAAWARLQETCADESPIGQNSCEYRSRMYQANYSEAAVADFEKYLLGRIAEACDPPKSHQELECEKLARVIERERSISNDKGIAYWTQRADDAGCT